MRPDGFGWSDLEGLGWDMPEAVTTMPVGYDDFKLATPPEYEEAPTLRPCWADRMPVGSCGRRWGSHCTLPDGHSALGLRCNLEGPR